MTSQQKPSPTAYDDSFRTMLNDCMELIIPVVNEAFGETYMYSYMSRIKELAHELGML